MTKKRYITFIASVLAIALILATVALTVGACKHEEEKPKYTVTFNSNGGSAVESQQLEEGAAITRPADPTKEMFTFDKWYSDASYKNPFDFNTKMPAHDLTLYAGWTPEKSVLVSFDANGGLFSDGTKLRSSVYKQGQKATAPSDKPTKTGYVFGGWYVSDAATSAFDFNTALNQNITLYARWNDSPNYVYVSYFGNGKLLQRDALTKGATLSQASVDLSDYVVDGWYTQQEMTSKFTFGTALQNNINLYAIYYTDGLVFDNGVVIGYNGQIPTVVIPPVYEGKAVTAIGEFAFNRSNQYCPISEVVLPSSVTTLGEGAFYGCSYLESIDLSNVTTLGKSVFHGAERLKNIGSLAKITAIPDSAFLGCKSLKSIELSDNVTSIGEYAFSDCKSLTTMVVPRNVTVISNNMFDGCNMLTKVEFATVQPMSFGKEIFVGCSSLQSIVIQSTTRAVFTAVGNGYERSPFIDCNNAVIYVRSNVLSSYISTYGTLDEGTFGSRLSAIS